MMPCILTGSRLVDSAAQRDLARRCAEAPGARPTTKPAIGHRGEPSVAAACGTGDLGPTPGLRPTESRRTLALPRLNAPSSTSSPPTEGSINDRYGGRNQSDQSGL